MLFFIHHPAPTYIYTLSLHDALPISQHDKCWHRSAVGRFGRDSPIEWFASREFLRRQSAVRNRSEEHTSELQSRFDLVCRLLLEKKKKLIHCINYAPVLSKHLISTRL